MEIQKKGPVSVKPALMLCPDLKVSFNVIKGLGGLVTLRGTISNVGSANYAILSEARVIMNLAYPPKTYNQIGMSEQLCTTSFSRLDKGASFLVNCSFHIPAYEGWSTIGLKNGNAKRLFTLSVGKKNMSPFGFLT